MKKINPKLYYIWKDNDTDSPFYADNYEKYTLCETNEKCFKEKKDLPAGPAAKSPRVFAVWVVCRWLNWPHRFIVPGLIVGVLMKCLSSSMKGYPKLI